MYMKCIYCSPNFHTFYIFIFFYRSYELPISTKSFVDEISAVSGGQHRQHQCYTFSQSHISTCEIFEDRYKSKGV